MSEIYDHKKIEKKWQEIWEKEGVYKTLDSSQKKKMYILDMFPYPSGAGLHVGHPRGYIGSDVISRMRRMQGFNVLHPMGFDAFGLPAEQYAIQTGEHPSVITEKAIETYKKQLEIIGLSYDWSREVQTIDPKYYKWTQWIFLKLFDSYFDEKEGKAKPISELVARFEKEDLSWSVKSEKEKEDLLMNYRLAYEGYSEVNWCPELGTVLANDEIVDGPDGKPVSERGGFPVEKKNMRQWFLRITAYADRLLSGFETINWPEHIKEIQRNWIGKSVGAEIEFSISLREENYVVPEYIDHKNPPLEGKPIKERKNIHAIVYCPKKDAYLTLKWKNYDWHTIVVGGVDDGENIVESARREVQEETGYTNLVFKGILGGEVRSQYFAAHKDENRIAITTAIYFELANEEKIQVSKEEENLHEVVWVSKSEFKPEEMTNIELPLWFERIEKLKKGSIKVFTTRPDTLFGVTFVAVSGEKERFTERYVINPVNGEEVPIWEAPYVMEGYGTGAVMGVPAHDERDFEFAKRNGLPVKIVVAEQINIIHNDNSLSWVNASDLQEDLTLSKEQEQVIILQNENYQNLSKKGALEWPGVLVNSGKFSGKRSWLVKKEITEFVGGKMVTKYKMRDAIFARQRYWGEPIPLKHVGDVIKPLSENELPLELPKVDSYKPTGTGESPLAGVPEWVEKGLETNTMPGWAGSSWYFLRYMDPKNTEAFAGKDAVEYWQDVDVYVGGAEHATGHLLYSRFWHKFLHDLGYVPTEEPFKLLKNQGLILASDGRKMSKRWGNVVNPDEMVDRFGADSFRLYEMFIGPFDQYTAWNTDGLVGTRRFLERVWRAKDRIGEASHEVDILVNKTIKKITEDIENFRFNTSVSSMMILVNKMEEALSFSKENYLSFLQILAPFAPHTTEELWHELGETSSIHKSEWPKADESKLKDEKVKIIIQINGKVRDEIECSPEIQEEELKSLVFEREKVKEKINNDEIKKIIYVRGKIFNIVL